MPVSIIFGVAAPGRLLPHRDHRPIALHFGLGGRRAVGNAVADHLQHLGQVIHADQRHLTSLAGFLDRLADTDRTGSIGRNQPFRFG